MKNFIDQTKSVVTEEHEFSRRAFLGGSAVGLASAALVSTAFAEPSRRLPPLATPKGPADIVARDDSYWRRVAAYYRVSKSFTNLEAGFWGMMASPVFAQYIQNLERVNEMSSFYARGEYNDDLEKVRARVATALGADNSEIAFCRGATEAMQCLIGGYNRLKAGDAVMYADVDYPAMQYAMNWLADRRGVRVVRLAVPEPATRHNVVTAYVEALDTNPDVRLLLLTHLNNKSGLILPVAKIVALARSRNVDVVLDAAHSWGQTTLRVPDFGADFIGFNVHKWIGAPIGIGVVYIRKERLNDIDRMMRDEENPPDTIRSRVHTGTMNFAAVLTVPAAIDLHVSIGPTYKAARLRYLRDRWVGQVRELSDLEILTPDDPEMVAGITSFRFTGQTSREANDRIVNELLKRFGLFTVRRSGLERGDCVRVTPALYNYPADLDRLAQALKLLSLDRR